LKGVTLLFSSPDDFLTGRGDVFAFQKIISEFIDKNTGFVFEQRAMHVTEEKYTRWIKEFARLKTAPSAGEDPLSLSHSSSTASSSSPASSSSSQDDTIGF
jgi:hypothetical protein